MFGPGTATIDSHFSDIDLHPCYRHAPPTDIDRALWQKRLVGDSAAIQRIKEVIKLVAPRRTTVLITGETGTGKEAVARAIHEASPREARGFVPVNCAAIPESLFESELFGHSKGAFTGAALPRAGYFERAHSGTIFLDEIGEMPLQLQGKLLRVLQERVLERLGGTESIPVDCRVIAASNSELSRDAQNGRFRSDLYYRLSVVSIHVPPLRERREDIPALTDHFLEKTCRMESIRPPRISPGAMRKLTEHQWPGNVRELAHAIESGVVLADGRAQLCSSDLHLGSSGLHEVGTILLPNLPAQGVVLDVLVKQLEVHLIGQAMQRSLGVKAQAANLLGMKRPTLIHRLRRLAKAGLELK